MPDFQDEICTLCGHAALFHPTWSSPEEFTCCEPGCDCRAPLCGECGHLTSVENNPVGAIETNKVICLKCFEKEPEPTPEDEWEECSRCHMPIDLDYELEPPNHRMCWHCSTVVLDQILDLFPQLIEDTDA